MRFIQVLLIMALGPSNPRVSHQLRNTEMDKKKGHLAMALFL
jgi:hypothetical protein